MEPKVAVIVPVYNMERYLRECLDSLVGQTFKDIEIICFNDASTDSSIDILREYAARDERFVIIDSPVNIKQGGGRNAGIRAARAPYIMFVDPDDWVEPDFVEKYYNKAIETGADIVVGDEMVFKDGKVTYGTLIAKDLGSDVEYIKRERLKFPLHIFICIYNKNLFFDNDLFFPENIQLGEDNAISASLFLAAKKIVKIDSAHYYYRIHSSSSCHTTDSRRINWQLTTALCALHNLRRMDSDNKFYLEITQHFIKLYFANPIQEISTFYPKSDISTISQIISGVTKYVTESELIAYINAQPRATRYFQKTVLKSPYWGVRLYKALSLIQNIRARAYNLLYHKR